MSSSQYRFVTRWRVEGMPEEVYASSMTPPASCGGGRPSGYGWRYSTPAIVDAGAYSANANNSLSSPHALSRAI
jgi:hypothetical protein